MSGTIYAMYFAGITMAALPIDEKRAPAFGPMKIDEEKLIIEFAEKEPQGFAKVKSHAGIYSLKSLIRALPSHLFE